MLILLLVATLIAFTAALTLPLVISGSPAFWSHLILAMGVMSLISAAMLHFVPVLTRGRPAGKRLNLVPVVLLGTGTVVTLTFALDFALPGLDILRAAGASLAILILGVLLHAFQGYARRCLGPAHPGLNWYIAALGLLVVGLLSVPLMVVWPSAYSALREFHLHLNLYGFVGLTAIGTLQVLAPTVANHTDPGAAPRLRQDLPWALTGSVALAVGKGLALNNATPLATLLIAAGGIAWAWPLFKLLRAWVTQYGHRLFRWHDNLSVLLAALLGFSASLLDAVLHVGINQDPLHIFLPGFLLALVSGAAAHLAPVWLNPGTRTERLNSHQTQLSRHAGGRAILFLTAAMLPLAGYQCSGMPALLALVLFLAGLVRYLLADKESPA